MALSGLWGSIFSRKGGSVLSKPWKVRPFRKIRLQVSAPVAPVDATLKGLQDVVANLRGAVR